MESIVNIALWVVQGILAVVFVSSGISKSTLSKERMIATGQTGVAAYPLPFIRVIAALEIVGAVGLIAPQAFAVSAILTPLAAIGLAIIMLGAAASHWRLGEFTQVFGVNLVLLLACLFVAWGRLAGW